MQAAAPVTTEDPPEPPLALELLMLEPPAIAEEPPEPPLLLDALPPPGPLLSPPLLPPEPSWLPPSSQPTINKAAPKHAQTAILEAQEELIVEFNIPEVRPFSRPAWGFRVIMAKDAGAPTYPGARPNVWRHERGSSPCHVCR